MLIPIEYIHGLVINRADCNVNVLGKITKEIIEEVINRADCNVNDRLLQLLKLSLLVINRADCNVN